MRAEITLLTSASEQADHLQRSCLAQATGHFQRRERAQRDARDTKRSDLQLCLEQICLNVLGMKHPSQESLYYY